MSAVIRVQRVGGPDVMRVEDESVGEPGPGEVLIRHTAIGLNFIDVYYRNGHYPADTRPFTPGLEAAGVVEAIGPGVLDVAPGDRVAYASRPLGAYCELRTMPADRVIVLPKGIDNRVAAAVMLKGMTAQYLLRRTKPVRPGDVVLLHAAAGGVGLLACQWAKHLGATVIGTVGTEAKAQLAAAHGCDYPIVYTQENFAVRVREITSGRGVDVVYDSVGKSTFTQSLDCLVPRGMMVSFGQSSGAVPPLDISVLSAKGSIYLTRPTLMTYTARREDLLLSASELFDVLLKGVVKVEVHHTYPLLEVARAHRDLESRKTTGSTILLP